ncbi:hypothetical protein MSG28_005732 [Choristoneura fumiferana]|uniref:Uncharacterized protein n=1 Tax=Choristoneura fumiferana TaxID=7141 RepID=A0ACC0KZU0_CHOFU|nr:hypothetical protein MSG28_005732 [Choristoneura fumiferana]
MDQLPLNPVLKFNPNQLYEVRKLFGLEDKDKLKQAIDQFEDWIKKQNHFDVTDFDRGFLERLIIFSKGSLERAKQHDFYKELCSDSHIDCMKFMEKATTNESRRLTSTFNDQYYAMPGSFRTLCVD